MPLEQNHQPRHYSRCQNQAGSIVPCGPLSPAALVMSSLVAASSWWMLTKIFLFVHRIVFFNGYKAPELEHERVEQPGLEEVDTEICLS